MLSLIKPRPATISLRATFGASSGRLRLHLNKFTSYGVSFTMLYLSRPTFWPKGFCVTQSAQDVIRALKIAITHFFTVIGPV
jgi:hypothetical protein